MIRSRRPTTMGLKEHEQILYNLTTQELWSCCNLCVFAGLVPFTRSYMANRALGLPSLLYTSVILVKVFISILDKPTCLPWFLNLRAGVGADLGFCERGGFQAS